MALGLAKSVIVKFSQSGAQEVKGYLKDVAAGAKDVGDKALTTREKLAALRLELAAVKRTGGDLGDVRRRIAEIGDAATTTALKMSAMRLALAAAGGAGGIGAGGAAASAAAGGGGLLGTGVTGVALGAGAGIIGLLSGAGGIIPLLAAAGMAVASFGALALPTITKLTALLSQPGLQPVRQLGGRRGLPFGTAGTLSPVAQLAQDVRGVEAEFAKLAVILQPLVVQIAGVGVAIAQKLLPALLPLARVGGQAILTLLKGFDKFASSPGFKSFTAEMTKLAGPAIVTLGEGIGKVAVAVGKLLQALVNPAALKIVRELLRDIAGAITVLAWTIRHVTPGFIWFFKAIADGLAGWRSSFAQMGRDLKQWFGVDLPHWIGVGVAWFESIKAKVSHALDSLPGVLRAIGANAISALIAGFKSIPVIGSVINIGQTIIGGFKSILGIHSPSAVFTQIGFFIGEGLIDGLLSTGKRAAAAAAAISAIFTARFTAIAAYARQVIQSAIQFAGIAGAATGPGYGIYSPGRAAFTTFTALGAPVLHPAVAASGTPPPTAAGIIRNLRLDAARLRAFSGIIRRLSQLGLSRFVIAEIVQAGPDAGYQIAEALIDAGRGAIRQVNAEQNAIFRYAGQLGLNAAQAQFGGPGGNVVVNLNIGTVLGSNPQQLAQEIRKLLLMLKRQHGGQALGLS